MSRNVYTSPNPSVSAPSPLTSTPTRLQIDFGQLNKKKEYVCNNCKRNFGSRKKERDSHFVKCKKYLKFVVFEAKGVIKCGFCDILSNAFHSAAEAFRHIEKKHEAEVVAAAQAKTSKSNENVQCQDCHASVASKGMTNHRVTCRKYKGIIMENKCLVCGGREFDKRSKLLTHVGKKHREKIRENEAAAAITTPTRSVQNPETEPAQPAAAANTEPELPPCEFCTQLVSKKNERKHLERCQKASEFIANGRKCIACQSVHDSRKAVYIHVLQAHRRDLDELGVETVEDAIEDFEGFETPQENNNVQPAPMQSRQKETPKYPLILVNNRRRMSSPLTVTATGDPNVITKLYTCPFCQDKLGFYNHAQDHVIKYHQIPIENMRRLNLEFSEQYL